MKQSEKSRIDLLVVERGLVSTRARAQALVMAGKVLVGGKVVDKPGALVSASAEVVLKEDLPYVGRGGLKLAGALDAFKVDVTGLTVADVGSSTGGFTDCLLKRGASRVFAIDVGKGLLDWSLRNDARVTLLEGVNIRHIDPATVSPKASMAVIDVSFISLEKVLPSVVYILSDAAIVLALVKPQFEVGKGEVGRGGVVRDGEKHRRVVERVIEFAKSIGLKDAGVCESPITGAKGNREFWVFLRKN
jgi:23S rRNA (cytidine1920-2'-O)/16S rRNA (cytidine1409-2'-O)-methyltransferase